MKKIYVKLEDIPETTSRKDFIREFVRNKPNTYNNVDCNDLQCEKNKFRSITELHQVVKSRFPVTSFEAIIRIVRDLINEANPISMVYCTQVRKVVLKYLANSDRRYITDYSRKNLYDEQGLDGYSLRDYETMINKIKK